MVVLGAVFFAGSVSAQTAPANQLGSRGEPGANLRYERLSNTRFEHAPEENPFDWALDVPASLELTRKDGLQLRFQGAENLDLSHLHQHALVSPGRYRFSAEIQATGLSTDQGPYFRIVDGVDDKRLEMETPQIHGDVARSWITTEFNVGQGTEVVDVQLRRNPSLRFDNLIAGSLHVFAVSLSAIKVESAK